MMDINVTIVMTVNLWLEEDFGEFTYKLGLQEFLV